MCHANHTIRPLFFRPFSPTKLGCLGGEEGLQVAFLRLHRCVLRDIVPIVWHVGQVCWCMRGIFLPIGSGHQVDASLGMFRGNSQWVKEEEGHNLLGFSLFLQFYSSFLLSRVGPFVTVRRVPPPFAVADCQVELRRKTVRVTTPRPEVPSKRREIARLQNISHFANTRQRHCVDTSSTQTSVEGKPCSVPPDRHGTALLETTGVERKTNSSGNERFEVVIRSGSNSSRRNRSWKLQRCSLYFPPHCQQQCFPVRHHRKLFRSVPPTQFRPRAWLLNCVSRLTNISHRHGCRSGFQR